MSSPSPASPKLLLVRAGARLCGLRVESVIETMRPLPASPIAGAPPFVRGIAIVRGEPAPVVDLAALLDGGAAGDRATRFVTVRAGPRPVALAVDAVLGVAQVDARTARRLPLVSDACAGALEGLCARDEELLLVLAATRLVPEAVYRVLDGWEADA